MKLTLGQVKQSRIPDFLGFDPQDTRLVQIVNEAHQRLMMQGLFWGTYQTYQICVSSEGCLTWPRQVASIEALAVNDQPITLRNNWFEYLQTGFGIHAWKLPPRDRCRICAPRCSPALYLAPLEKEYIWLLLCHYSSTI